VRQSEELPRQQAAAAAAAARTAAWQEEELLHAVSKFIRNPFAKLKHAKHPWLSSKSSTTFVVAAAA
jgi:hypothetical protein